MAAPQVVVQRQRDGYDDGHDQEDDMVPLEARGRHFGLVFHGVRSLAASFFSIVVLASHSSPSGTVLRCCGTNPRRLKNSSALSLTSAVNRGAPREAASFSRASINMEPTPCPAAAG